ncbi:MAG: O-antigen polymerase [Candidatus Buchananbacteria bacterium]
MNLLLLIIFFLASLSAAGLYFFGREKFSPAWLMVSLWSAALAVSQLYLSPLERPLNWRLWLAVTLFFAVFAAVYYCARRLTDNKLPKTDKLLRADSRLILIAIGLMALASVIANIYIFSRFGTLPILSSIPDKMRFIINKEIFGVFEWLSLLPRLFIPLAFLELILDRKTMSKWLKLFYWFVIAVGLAILCMYASRLIIVITVLLCYFGYLMINRETIKLKKLLIGTLIAGAVILSVSVAIPAFRQFITYRDYNYQGEYNPFSYITTISQVNLPPALQFLTPIYLVPVFNLQALDRGMEFYAHTRYYGAAELSVFNSALKLFHLPQFSAPVDWNAIFVPWWITATFLFPYYLDFGWWGIALAGVFWGLLLGAVYTFAVKRPNLLSIALFAYFSFVCIMSIYTNYFQREELFMDLALIVLVFIATYKKNEIKKTTR